MRASGDKTPTVKKSFADVKTNQPHAAAITWMKETGVSNGKFCAIVCKGHYKEFLDSGYSFYSIDRNAPAGPFGKLLNWLTD